MCRQAKPQVSVVAPWLGGSANLMTGPLTSDCSLL